MPTTIIRIERLGGLGDGLGRLEGQQIAVPFSAPGDLAEVDVSAAKGRKIGRIHRLIEHGPHRASPLCPHFGKCGGCRTQHISVQAYERWKDGLWRVAFGRAGIDEAVLQQADIQPLTVVSQQSRRRARLAIRRNSIGFRMERSHRIEPIADCAVLAPSLLAAAKAIGQISQLDGCDVSLTALDDGIEAVIHGLREPDYGCLQDLADLAATLDLARMSYQVGGEDPTPISHRREGIIQLGGLAVTAPPAPFLQATRQGERFLRDLVVRWLSPAEKIADMYCGCGAFGVPLALERPTRQVIAADKDGPAVAALANAVRRSNLSSRLRCDARNLMRDPFSGRELDGLDGVVFDPPRAGARAQAEALAFSTVRDVVAISCNPASFARDAAILIDGGYRLAAIAPLDQFLWTAHLEIAAHFRKD